MAGRKQPSTETLDAQTTVFVLGIPESKTSSTISRLVFPLQELVDLMPEETQSCARLAFQGRTRTDIAIELGLDESTVASRLQRIKLALTRHFEEETPGEGGDLNAEIDLLYQEIARLSQKAPSAASEEKVSRALDRLRALQHQEADLYERHLKSRLKLPIDAGARILEQADNLRGRLEDLVAHHRTAKSAISS